MMTDHEESKVRPNNGDDDLDMCPQCHGLSRIDYTHNDSLGMCEECRTYAGQEASESAAPLIPGKHFGLCPECHNDPKMMAVENDWFAVCLECKLRWGVGRTPCLSWAREGKSAWNRNARTLFGCRDVEAYYGNSYGRPVYVYEFGGAPDCDLAGTDDDQAYRKFATPFGEDVLVLLHAVEKTKGEQGYGGTYRIRRVFVSDEEYGHNWFTFNSVQLQKQDGNTLVASFTKNPVATDDSKSLVGVWSERRLRYWKSGSANGSIQP